MKRFGLPATVGLFFIVLTFYSLFSYSLTAPNLTLVAWPPYTAFQAWMWETFFNNRPLLTYTYTTLVILISISYWLVTKSLSDPRSKNVKQLSSALTGGVLVGVAVLPLLFAVNALSYDVFNYLFNAKMVMVYDANPHVQVALDFPEDPWIRFMHNTHTPAPYGYGWTALSLVPYVIGNGSFLLTWLLFRVMSLVSLAWLGITLWRGGDTRSKAFLWWCLIVLLNPLLLIEVVANFHNDLWMMAPAVGALLLVRPGSSGTVTKWLGSLLLLGFSISIKLASLALVPLWLLLLLAQWKKIPIVGSELWQRRLASILDQGWAVFASILMFLPLLTPRSQQFHPWYLTWVLVWLPFFPRSNSLFLRTWRVFVLALSVTSLFRYIPFLWHGLYTPEIVWQQQLITWVPAGLIALGTAWWFQYYRLPATRD